MQGACMRWGAACSTTRAECESMALVLRNRIKRR
jgi:hypothetical protein